MTQNTDTIVPIPADRPGALDGFGASCPRCGMQITASFRSIVETDMARHLDWHFEVGR